MLISRGCPNACDFCYVAMWFLFRGGTALLHLPPLSASSARWIPCRESTFTFSNDNLFADRPLSEALFQEMRGMGRLFQGAMTVRDAQDERLVRPCA